jgi:hypothetical protein
MPVKSAKRTCVVACATVETGVITPEGKAGVRSPGVASPSAFRFWRRGPPKPPRPRPLPPPRGRLGGADMMG